MDTAGFVLRPARFASTHCLLDVNIYQHMWVGVRTEYSIWIIGQQNLLLEIYNLYLLIQLNKFARLARLELLTT